MMSGCTEIAKITAEETEIKVDRENLNDSDTFHHPILFIIDKYRVVKRDVVLLHLLFFLN